MGRVCLILPVAPARDLSTGWVARCRGGLEAYGHTVDVLAVLDPRDPRPCSDEAVGWSWHVAEGPGLSQAVMSGLAEAAKGRAADADALIVLDPTRGYQVEDLNRLVEPLVEGRADLVLSRRDERVETGRRGRARTFLARGASRVCRPLFGVSDPSAGLLATTPALARGAARSFSPVGSRFALDLLLRSSGRRAEVLVRDEGPPSLIPLHLDDLRNLKRLADDRYGNASRLAQFCAVGASGMVVDLAAYAVFQVVFSATRLVGQPAPLLGGSLDLAAAGTLAIGLALTWNFSLNRRLTFNDARHGSIARQFLTYALGNALGIALSLTLRLYLPSHVGFFRRHKLAAAVVGIASATGISYSAARWLAFGRRSQPREPGRRRRSHPVRGTHQYQEVS